MAPAEGTPRLAIEVVYSPAAGQVDHVELALPPGATVHDAVLASGVLERHPSAADAELGVWGRLAPAQQPLRDRDRVELYRPLTVDPKEARRLRYRGQGGRRRLAR